MTCVKAWGLAVIGKRTLWLIGEGRFLARILVKPVVNLQILSPALLMILLMKALKRGIPIIRFMPTNHIQIKGNVKSKNDAGAPLLIAKIPAAITMIVPIMRS
jgi:hypothetical protein